MNGPHDLGGRGDFGAVASGASDARAPRFHADWERRALGVTLACGALGHWTLDESRHARERLPPATYHGSSYYRIWIEALERLLVRHGEVSPEELADGLAREPGRRADRRLEAARVPAALAAGAPTQRSLDARPRFAVGDPVRTVNDHVRGHTRLPGYARDKPGTIEAVHAPHVLPDASAAGLGERPEWLYTVAFDGAALWGAGTEPGLVVTLEAWESYLSGVPAAPEASPGSAAQVPP